MPLKLEIIERRPATLSPQRPPLLFVHGAYSAAWVWDEYWMPWLAERGWHCLAPSLEGHGKSEGSGWLSAVSIDDYVGNVAQVMETLDTPPVLIGHSMGGFVIQRGLELGWQATGVGMIASVPPRGMTQASTRMLSQTPDLIAALNLFQADKHYHPNIDQARRLLFSSDMPQEQLRAWLPHFQPESMRAVFDMLMVGVFTPPALPALPALVLGAAEDKIIAHQDVVATARRFGTRAEILPHAGHMMMLDVKWEDTVRELEHWLNRHWSPHDRRKEDRPA